MRHPLVVLASSLLVLCAAAGEAAAACAASSTHVCVNHNGAVFQLDTGSGYTNQPVLAVTPAVQLTFEIDSSCSNCSFHPFYVSTSSSGAGAGFVAGGITTGSFVFTPTANQLQSGLYYQCQIHALMGAQIVDVTFDGGAPDAGSDAGTDGGSTDAGSTDAGSTDAGSDAASTDAGSDAATSKDAAADDAATPQDAAAQDAAKPDAGVVPQTDDDGSCAVAVPGRASGAAGGAALALGLAVMALRRRRR